MSMNQSAQERTGRILSCIGGIYTVLSKSREIQCYAKGTFRHDGITPLAGDYVTFCLDQEPDQKRNADGYIKAVHPRKNALVRPPLANIDRLFLVATLHDPVYSPLALDKMIVLAVHNRIEPILILNKCDLTREPEVQAFFSVYKTVGCPIFTLSAILPDPEIQENILALTKGVTSAFAGASGVGKSTIINALFPAFDCETGDLSTKTARGKHTTRQSRLFQLDETSYLADTPGFTLLDFERFFFISKEELPYSFPEFVPFLGQCKYTKCTHKTEDGCAILAAIRVGEVSASRHESYVSLLSEVSVHKPWEIKK